MGREVRMVPKDWVHPEGKALYGGSYAKAAAEWDEAKAKWNDGLRENWGQGAKWIPRDDVCADCQTYEDWNGPRPVEGDYMPDWPDAERTHLMMYENTSEGTPISPAFETPEELARWLADTGASSFGSSTASYEAWLNVCRGGYAPSAVMVGGRIMSGVEATTLAD